MTSNTYVQFELIKCFDEFSDSYSFYWINQNGIICSPYFETEEGANNWYRTLITSFNALKEKK